MTAPSFTRSLLAASLLARSLSDLRDAERAHDEDAALTIEVALLLRLAALRVLTLEQADVLAMARAALQRPTGTLRDAVAPVWAAATRGDGAFRARWRATLAPILRDALTRVSAQFGGALDARTIATVAAERADLAAYQLGRTTASKVTTALRELARAGVTDTADPRIGYRVGAAIDGRGKAPYPAEWVARTAAATEPPTLSIGPLVFRDRTLPPLPIVAPVQRAAVVSKYEAGIVARATFMAARAAGFTRVQWLHAGAPLEPRPEHLGLNGFIVPIGETFGRTGLMYPRDPEGDVSQTVNCTCSARFLRG